LGGVQDSLEEATVLLKEVREENVSLKAMASDQPASSPADSGHVEVGTLTVCMCAHMVFVCVCMRVFVYVSMMMFVCVFVVQHESIVKEIEEALRKEIVAASTLTERPR